MSKLNQDLLLNLLVARRLLRESNVGHSNLERLEIDRCLCLAIKVPFQQTEMGKLDRLCKIQEMKLTKELKGYAYA